MSEWLDLMLEEIARKRREEREAQQELERRAAEGSECKDDAARPEVSRQSK